MNTEFFTVKISVNDLHALCSQIEKLREENATLAQEVERLKEENAKLREGGGQPYIKQLDFDQLRIANVDRCEKSFSICHDWTPTDWACAMAGECGEACNLIKKLRRGEIVDLEIIGKELSDVVIYVDLLAHNLGLNLGECVRKKFNEVSDRVKSEVRL